MPAPKNQNLSTDEQSCGRFVSLLSFPLNVMSAVKVALVCVGANTSDGMNVRQMVKDANQIQIRLWSGWLDVWKSRFSWMTNR